MISSRKFQLLTLLVLLGCYFPALCQEPNEVKTELRFEISAEKQGWPVSRDRQREIGIRPTYMAEVLAANVPPASRRAAPRRHRPMRPVRTRPRSWRNAEPHIDFGSPYTIRAILDTPSGKCVSEQEREFFTTGWGLLFRPKESGDEIPNYTRVLLYAVSEEDAKKIACAFIEFLRKEADKEMEFWRNEKQKLLERIPNLKKRIRKREERRAAAQKKLEELRGILPYLSTDEAKEAILHLNKTLNTVRIELRTREARIEAIQAAISDNLEKQRVEMGKRPEERINRTDILQMLEQMQVNAMIELTTARAKRDVVEQMTSQAREFVKLHRVLEGLPKPGDRSDRLKAELGSSEHGLEKVEEKLANPTPEVLPPRVYENKVTLYPVRVDE